MLGNFNNFLTQRINKECCMAVVVSCYGNAKSGFYRATL